MPFADGTEAEDEAPAALLHAGLIRDERAMLGLNSAEASKEYSCRK